MTQGLTSNPNSTAFFANNPAPIKTFGLDVFVHDVISAINTDPSLISKSVPLTFEICFFFLDVVFSNTSWNLDDASFNNTLSWGLFGPEIVGTRDDISNETVSVNSILSQAHSPWSFAYFSTVRTVCSSLPETVSYTHLTLPTNREV